MSATETDPGMPQTLAMGPWKSPQRVDFVAELPKSATAKAQRFRLRESAVGAAPEATGSAGA